MATCEMAACATFRGPCRGNSLTRVDEDSSKAPPDAEIYLELGSAQLNSVQTNPPTPAYPNCQFGEYLGTYYLEPYQPVSLAERFAPFPDFDPGDLADLLIVATSAHGGLFGWSEAAGLRWIPREAECLADTTYLGTNLATWPQALLGPPLRPAGLLRPYWVPQGALVTSHNRSALSDEHYTAAHQRLRAALPIDAELLESISADTYALTVYWSPADQSLVRVNTRSPEIGTQCGWDSSVEVRTDGSAAETWDLLGSLGWLLHPLDRPGSEEVSNA
jgi:hypothetical protein